VGAVVGGNYVDTNTSHLNVSRGTGVNKSVNIPIPLASAKIDEEILFEKENKIRELQETVQVLELKIAKLESLVRMKDSKLQSFIQKKVLM